MKKKSIIPGFDVERIWLLDEQPTQYDINTSFTRRLKVEFNDGGKTQK